MTSQEKAEMLKTTITQLYTNEGRTISYISRLLEINRTTVAHKIKEWSLKDPKPMHRLTPSNQKFLNKHKNLIKSRLDNNISMTKIAEELKISRHTLFRTFIQNDEILRKAHEDYTNRIYEHSEQRKENLKANSSRNYDNTLLDGEIWKPIVGYNGYEVSNKGRIRHYAARYKSYIILRTQPNSKNGRIYVTITDGNKKKNLMVARIVAHAFVTGFSDENNTVNHIDGDITNNCSDNLAWASQSENNTHSYKNLGRTKVRGKRYKFDKILYKNKYEFKTITAFAKFIGKSETQTRRYIDEPEKYEIKLINNRND